MKDVLKKLQRHDDDERLVMPCYFFTKVILQYLLLKDKPILLVAKDNRSANVLHFEPDNTKRKFILQKSLIEINTDYPCFVVAGRTKTFCREKFLQRGLLEILMMNMAAHPQYTGKRLADFRDNPFLDVEDVNESFKQELKTMQDLARQFGCSRENDSLFLVEHIYCSTYRAIMRKNHLPSRHPAT